MLQNQFGHQCVIRQLLNDYYKGFQILIKLRLLEYNYYNVL